MHSGDPDKMLLYSKRAFHGKLEPANGVTREKSMHHLKMKREKYAKREIIKENP
jgi:hypothetical protein